MLVFFILFGFHWSVTGFSCTLPYYLSLYFCVRNSCFQSGSQVKGLSFAGDKGFTVGREVKQVTSFLCLLLQQFPLLLLE